MKISGGSPALPGRGRCACGKTQRRCSVMDTSCHVLLACKEREKASRKTPLGAVSLSANTSLQVGLRRAGISCPHGSGPDGTHVRRNRREQGHRRRDRAATV